MNLRVVINRIEKIEERIAPKPRAAFVVIWSFGSDDEPHGKYGYRKLHIHTGEKEPCTQEEELKLLLKLMQPFFSITF